MSYWNKEDAVLYLDINAAEQSKGKCAQYTREAIEAGGLVLAHNASARQYGDSLQAAGFTPLNFTPAAYEKGDVVIIEGFQGHPHGHMAMYDGTHWVSDFKQRGIYPGHAYRKHQPGFTVYRHTR